MYVFVELSEYSTGKSLWNSQTGKPATMIKKVAEAQALRMAFQDLLGGTYGEEEFSRSPQKLQVISPTTQTERLKTFLNVDNVDKSTGEIIEGVHHTGHDDQPISQDQIAEISTLIEEKHLTEEQITKALSRYNVTEIDQLMNAQAQVILLRLRGND
jgi:hypothetical protein